MLYKPFTIGWLYKVSQKANRVSNRLFVEAEEESNKEKRIALKKEAAKHSRIYNFAKNRARERLRNIDWALGDGEQKYVSYLWRIFYKGTGMRNLTQKPFFWSLEKMFFNKYGIEERIRWNSTYTDEWYKDEKKRREEVRQRRNVKSSVIVTKSEEELNRKLVNMIDVKNDYKELNSN